MCIHVYIYIYIYIEREREGEIICGKAEFMVVCGFPVF